MSTTTTRPLDVLDSPLAKRLVLDESREKFPYIDTAGKVSIGVGRNLTDRGLSDDEIDYLFRNDLRQTLRECQTFEWFSALSENRQVVVASMVFNLGLPKVNAFVNFLAAVRRRDFLAASAEMLKSRWARQVGARADRLAAMMRDG